MVREALSTPSGPVPEPDRSDLEHQLGQDFSQVRVHSGPLADRAAGAVGAGAYTVGRDIVLAQGRYIPGTSSGRRLIAHELAHVIQQSAAGSGTAVPARGDLVVGAPGAAESRAEAAAQAATAGRNGQPVGDRSGDLGRAPVMVQGDFGAPHPHTGRLSGAAAVIPIADFIRDVEEVERANPGDSPAQTLSRIRVQWYGSARLSDMVAFGSLIPDADAYDLVSTPIYRPEMDSDERLEPKDLGAIPAASRDRLLAHADENATGDNPSPYIQLPSGERIDAGHLFLAADALIHPRTSSPYTTYTVPNIDPSSWVADVGIASVWMTHAQAGDPHPDAPRNPSPPVAADYFRMSAPDEDLLGDIDAFGLDQDLTAHPGPLSATLRRFYLGGPGVQPSSSTRFQTFCARNGITYNRSGTGIAWDPSWRGPVIDRINRFNDLYDAGPTGAARAMITGGTTHRTWPRTPDMLDLLLAWLKPRLEAEIAAGAAAPGVATAPVGAGPRR